MRLREGESNMLAGLVREEDRKVLRGFAGLMRVPILKDIFGGTEEQVASTDIVFLMTPRIVRTHELTQEHLNPIYIGSQVNLGLTGAPASIGAEPVRFGAIAETRAFLPVREGERECHADDRLDAGTGEGLGEFEGTEQIVGIGQRQRRRAVVAGEARKLRNGERALEQRIGRMHPKMHERLRLTHVLEPVPMLPPSRIRSRGRRASAKYPRYPRLKYVLLLFLVKPNVV